MKKLLFNISIYFFVVTTFGQTRIVSGTIVDQIKTPLPGAFVVIDGTEKGTQTDFDGKFSIEIEKGENLTVHYLGFKTKKIKTKNLSSVEIKLIEDATICFTTRDYYLPFKIYDIPAVHIHTIQDIYTAIQSNVPGVSIATIQFNETPKITMRGDPHTIVIVDGVRFDASILKTLNPQDIEKIEVATSLAASNYLLNNRN
mgnify:FL=1|tara:strand:- start:33621 stop:34220 length:600 start_codon:yes stop_codon:yes gene_type:complete